MIILLFATDFRFTIVLHFSFVFHFVHYLNLNNSNVPLNFEFFI